jgi:hypothetical protein
LQALPTAATKLCHSVGISEPSCKRNCICERLRHLVSVELVPAVSAGRLENHGGTTSCEGISIVADTQQASLDAGRSPPPIPPVVAPVLMMAFWMLLGGAAGIKIAQGVWPLLGFGGGEVAIAIPVGGVIGALAGALLGLIRNPRGLVLLMAVFAGSAAGAVAGKVVWGEFGEIGGQVLGGLVGGIAWAIWMFVGRGEESRL